VIYNKDVQSLLSNFPTGYTPSSQQVYLIEEIEKAFNEGYKFVVCCAPTGSGKSFISKTLGNMSKGCSSGYKELVESYEIFKRSQSGGYLYEEDSESEGGYGAVALTITKALQDQYKAQFDDTQLLKGKSNYTCAVDDSYNVEVAPCLLSKSLKNMCWKEDTCPYYKARNQAITAKFSSLNYNMFFSLPSHVKHREYMVCDEASELEDQLVKEFTCVIPLDGLKRYKFKLTAFPSTSDRDKVYRWISGLNMSIRDRIADLTLSLNEIKNKKSADAIAQRGELLFLQRLNSKLKTLIDTWLQSEYIIEREDKAISFTPLKVSKLSSRLFDYADKVLLMSATIIDPNNFCKQLGIEKFKYIEAPSAFDPKNAPIVVASKIKLNYNNLQANLPTIAKTIKTICDYHSNDKGIIHTQTNLITSYLKNNLKLDRVLYRETGVKNEDILEMHANSPEPTVLASPSMGYGVDLKGDLAKFQIIIKAPYLPMGDKRIEMIMKQDSSWYLNAMLSSLIQSCGRGVRSKDDKCITYILDLGIVEAVIKNKHKIPKYFLDRFI
jgi:Rad3-related DNA helicase